MLLVPAHYLFFLQQIKPVSKRELYMIVIDVLNRSLQVYM
jgi:hypothetical protein